MTRSRIPLISLLELLSRGGPGLDALFSGGHPGHGDEFDLGDGADGFQFLDLGDLGGHAARRRAGGAPELVLAVPYREKVVGLPELIDAIGRVGNQLTRSGGEFDIAFRRFTGSIPGGGYASVPQLLADPALTVFEKEVAALKTLVDERHGAAGAGAYLYTDLKGAVDELTTCLAGLRKFNPMREILPETFTLHVAGRPDDNAALLKAGREGGFAAMVDLWLTICVREGAELENCDGDLALRIDGQLSYLNVLQGHTDQAVHDVLNARFPKDETDEFDDDLDDDLDDEDDDRQRRNPGHETETRV